MKPRFWPLWAHKCDIRTVLASSKIHGMSPFNEKGHPHSLPPWLPDERLTLQVKGALSCLWSFNLGLPADVSARGQVLVLSPLRSQQPPWVLRRKLNQISQLATWWAGSSLQTSFVWLTERWLRRYVLKMLHHLPMFKKQKLAHKNSSFSAFPENLKVLATLSLHSYKVIIG